MFYHSIEVYQDDIRVMEVELVMQLQINTVVAKIYKAVPQNS